MHEPTEPGTPDAAAQPRLRARRGRRLLALLVAVFAAGGVFLVTPPGKALLLRTAAGWLRTRLGVEAGAAALEYRLLARGVTLHDVRVTLPGASRPMFRAERVDIDAAAGIVIGRLALRRVDVLHGEIVLDPATRGASVAVPGIPGRSVEKLPDFDIGRADLRDLAVTIDPVPGTRILIHGLSVSLGGEGPGRLRGSLGVSGGVSVQHPGTSIRFDRAGADVALAGTSLSFTSLTAESPVAHVSSAGRLDISRGNLEAKYDAQVNLGEVYRWWEDAPPGRGTIAGSGTIGGTVGQPVATFAARGERLKWNALTDLAVSVAGRWFDGDLVVDSYDASSRAATARLRGRALVAVGGDGRPSALRAEATVGTLRHFAQVAGAPALPDLPASLTADLTWPGPIPTAADLAGNIQVAALNGAGSKEPLATLQAQGRSGRWSIEQHAAFAGGATTAARLSITIAPGALSNSTIEGRVGLRAVDVTAAARDLRRRGFTTFDLPDRVERGRAAADATVSGTLGRPRVTVDASADSLAVAGLGDVSAEASLRADGPAIDVTRITAHAAGNRAEAHGAASVTAGTIDLAFEGQLDHPERLAARLPAQWRPTGTLAVSGRVGGSLRSPQLAARVSGSSLEANGLVVDSLDGSATFERGILHVSDLRLERGDGWLHLRGDVDGGLEHLAIHAQGERLALALRQPRIQAENVWLEGDLTGAWARPSGTLSATAGALALDGRELGPLTMSAGASDGTAHFDVQSPGHRAGVTGSVGLASAWPFEAHASLRQSPLESLLSLLGPGAAVPDTTGTATVSADISGSLEHPLDSSGVITVDQLDGQVGAKPLRLDRPGRIRFDGTRATVETPMRVTLGGFAAGLAPLPDGREGMRATIDGRIEDGLALLPPGTTPAAWLANGPVRADVSVTREGQHVVIAGDAEATLSQLVRAGQELARDVTLRARIGAGAIEISGVEGTVLGGPFAGSGRVPLSWALPEWIGGAPPADEGPPAGAMFSARADVSLARALEALAVPREDVSGSATVTIEARATAPRLDAVEATMSLSDGEVSLSNVSVTQQSATTFRFGDGRLEVSGVNWKGPRSTLTASGTVGILPGVDGDFRAEGTSALSFLRRLVPGAAGAATFQVRVAGRPGARRTSGTLTLDDASLIDPKRQLALAGVSGTLTFDQDLLETHDLHGQFNGGELSIDGAIPLRAGIVASRPLTVVGRGMFVEIPRGLRSQLDSTLSWESAAAGGRLSGQVSISSDVYRQPITALADLAASLSGPTSGPVRRLPPWIAATSLDIRFTSTGPIVVDQSALKLELVPDVRLAGTIGRPSLAGQVVIQDEGRIQAGGRSYRLTDSRLEFSPASGLLPRLNMMGETRVGSYLVTLRMTGPATDIETNLSSDPPLSERDVRSLLVTGQTSDPAGRNSEGNNFAVGAVSADVLGMAGQFVGLDSVRVGSEDLDLVSSDVNPATRLTVSKRLGTKFELVLSENLEDNESTWIVIYRPISNYEFRLSSEENTTQGLEFRQEITFGPGVSSHGRAKSVALVHEKVGAVTITGDPGFRDDEVLAGTKIRAGDRFDFREWLDDRERIARFYAGRGYLTARIVPLRAAGAVTASARLVDLQYRITRGPQTVLEIAGYAANDALLERLRQAWSANVLLQLLADSLTAVTRDYLADAGFLRARVQVEVDRPQAGTDRARIQIDPGPRTDSRRLAFSGNQVIASETLQRLAASRRLDAEAWKDPAPLLEAIRAAYASQGHLAARATAGAIEFSGTAATLPIRIEEGLPAHVASLRITGVAPDREPAAREAIALPTGSPFASGMGRAARARLERHFRERGYRDARVGVTGAASPGPDVALAFAVSEGPLYVVQSVEIAGLESTKPSLVSRAVRVAPGEPAGTAVSAETERRLYELGTFRRAEVRFDPVADIQNAGTVPVTAVISVEEARRFQLRYGVELSSEYNSALAQRTNSLGVAADLRDRNFLGRGLSLGGGLHYEPDLKSARGLFSIPRLAGLPIRTNVYLTARGEEDQTDEQVAVRDDEVELSIEQRWRIGRSVEYSWSYSSDWRDTRVTSLTRTVDPLAFSGTLASLNGAVVIDRRDSFFDAKRGWFGSVSTQWGQREFGSDVDYLRTLLRGSYYQPLGPVVLAGNVRWGRLAALGGQPPLTAFDLFFNAGGTESVRGYAQDALSAYEFLGAPLGGTKMLVVNGELRAPLFWRLGGVLFADAGNTFTQAQPIRFRDLAAGLGVGIRINTPLAPIRLDLGFPRRPGESGPRWHFSIGQIF